MKLPDAITTERLTIRPFRAGDLDSFLSFMLDESATRYLMFSDEQKTPEGAQGLFEFVMASYATDQPVFAYAIAMKDQEQFIGSCGLSEISGGDVFECYYSLLPDYWKMGFATEATRALIGYCFHNYTIKEICAYMSPENPNSAGVAERAGMKHRGTEVHPLFGNPARLYSITRDMVDLS